MFQTCILERLKLLSFVLSLLVAPALRANDDAGTHHTNAAEEEAGEREPPRKKRKKAPGQKEAVKSPKKRPTPGGQAEAELPDLPRNISADKPATKTPAADDTPAAEPDSPPEKRKVSQEDPPSTSKKRKTGRKKRSYRKPRRRAPSIPDEGHTPADNTCGEQCGQACAGACIEAGCQLCTGWCPLGALVGGFGMGATGAGLAYVGALTLQSPTMDEDARGEAALQSAWAGALVGATIGAIVGGSTGLALNMATKNGGGHGRGWPCGCP